MTLCSLMLFLGGPWSFSAEKREFKHPSIVTTQADLDRLKKDVVSNASVRSAYEKLKKSEYVDLRRPHTPYAIVKTVAYGTCKEEAAFRGDAQAAHAAALMWVITGDKRYRDKAVSILNDWATTYERLGVEKGIAIQVQLEAAWAAPIWTAAADIIRYYDDGAAGWKKEQIAAFDQFLNRMIKTARKSRHRNNNWGTSATLAIMAAAVYQDDADAYDEAVSLHKRHLKSISKKTGALGPDYLRDPWHPQYTILTWIQTCEIAWNQGDDLYGTTLDGQSQPRLSLCLEHFSKLFLGKLPNPKGLKKGDYKGSHRRRQGYAMAFNHFIGRRKAANAMPVFASMVPAWHPGGLDGHFIAWDSLTHSALPGKATQNKADAGDGK